MEQGEVKSVRSLQIIVGAMMAGLVMFGIVVLAVGAAMTPDPQMAGVLLAVLGVLGVTEVTGYIVLRSVLLGKLRSETEHEPSAEEVEQKVLPVWSTLILIRSAMTEGWGLFGGVIALVTGSTLGLGALVLSLVLLSLGFPTRDKLTQSTLSVTGRNPYST